MDGRIRCVEIACLLCVCVGVVLMRVFEGVLTCITMPVERVGG